MSEPDTATFHITIVIPVYHQRCQSDFFFCFDRYLNQWHFTHMILIGTRGLKWTSQTGHWIHGFFCCKCILAQMKIIQLGLFQLDQNYRFFQSKIDHFLGSKNDSKKQSILLTKNLQFWSNQKSPNCMIFIWATIHLQQKNPWIQGPVWLVHFKTPSPY